ncbi:hypothetical protein [Sodalis sp.]|uniref:hypothetical protein n=1 Tax=Sodalis sp. (in: enterobacteria) TaxID=1898979 RepID=UPI003873C784
MSLLIPVADIIPLDEYYPSSTMAYGVANDERGARQLLYWRVGGYPARPGVYRQGDGVY